MSSSIPDLLTAAVLTVSDSSSRGERADASGPLVVETLSQNNIRVVATGIVSDDQPEIENAIRRFAADAGLVVTTGGTGIAPRDVTPEATRAVCSRLFEGIPERMRSEGCKKTPFAALSRGICGVCGNSLVLNLPGSPAGAVDSLRAVIALLPHAVQLLQGKTQHPPEPRKG
jgi:molybdopterin adenylyltransferase